MLFMLKPGVAERLEAFVKGGGTLVLTYLSAFVNETELVFRGGLPGGGLRKVVGIWNEEIDSLYPESAAAHRARDRGAMALPASPPCVTTANSCTSEGATALATYQNDFYAGMPALTVNKHGAGRVYYLAARPAGDAFLDAFTKSHW